MYYNSADFFLKCSKSLVTRKVISFKQFFFLFFARDALTMLRTPVSSVLFSRQILTTLLT